MLDKAWYACVLGKTVSCAKMAELIKTQLGEGRG